jgi:hypothetical protein
MALGELAGSALTVAVFWMLGYFQMNVLWGAVAGCLVAVGNYFFMAVTVDLAADRAQRGEVKQAQSMVQLSSTVRLAVMGLLLFLCISYLSSSKFFHSITSSLKTLYYTVVFSIFCLKIINTRAKILFFYIIKFGLDISHIFYKAKQ